MSEQTLLPLPVPHIYDRETIEQDFEPNALQAWLIKQMYISNATFGVHRDIDLKAVVLTKLITDMVKMKVIIIIGLGATAKLSRKRHRLSLRDKGIALAERMWERAN